MTAKELYDLTKPLFAKHPSAKPYAYFFSPPYVEMEIDKITLTHELILTGHLVQWLAECDDKEGIEVVPNCGHSGDKWVLWSRFGNELLGGGPTLLHALVAACMEVEE